MLAEAKSEVRKQECRAEFLDSSFQRQLDSNRLEIFCTNRGYDESRNEQARLHEESAQRERVLRETQIRSIHEVGELKRTQEMRMDEFSRNELRESHATIQELTSQVQELQETMNYFGDSRECQDIESICRSLLSRDQSLRSETWNVSGTQGNFLGNRRAVIVSLQIPYQEILHSTNPSATGGNTVQKSTRRTCCER